MGFQGQKARKIAQMSPKSQINRHSVIIWGEAHGLTGKALRDGLDFWGGGFLALHGHLATLFDVRAYQAFFAGLYGKLPYHLWSYPPNYLLIALPFGWLPPWPAVLSFDLLSLLLLASIPSADPWALVSRLSRSSEETRPL